MTTAVLWQSSFISVNVQSPFLFFLIYIYISVNLHRRYTCTHVHVYVYILVSGFKNFRSSFQVSALPGALLAGCFGVVCSSCLICLQ